MMRGARRSNTTELTRGGTAGPPQNRARSAATTSSRDTEKRPINMAPAAQATMRAISAGTTHTRSRPFLVRTDVIVSSPGTRVFHAEVTPASSIGKTRPGQGIRTRRPG